MMQVDEFETVAELTLSRATYEDLRALEQMYREFEPRGEALGLPPRTDVDTAHWLATLSDDVNLLLRDGQRVVGHAVLCPFEETAEVAVFIHQDYRGRGAGRLLLAALIAEAKQLGLRRIWGIARPDNLPMLRLARTCGFVTGHEPGEFYLLLRNDETQPSEEKDSCLIAG